MSSAEMGILSDCSREERINFCRIVVHLIAADRKLTDEERVHLAALVWQAGLSLEEEDVKEMIENEISSPTPLEELVKGIDRHDMRRWLYRVLIEVSLADNHLAEEEENKLLEIARLFELDTEAARDLIRWTADSIELEKREAEIMARL
ncbi:MAG: TerB family tellurite resistance protein [Acidobacteriota bacterium]|nr:TerB family tellurite resistance protein [Blastocatellia bacterium]MDW8411424.1 TerB family tellurite resistance protein [Acidobacteriota bacterium]